MCCNRTVRWAQQEIDAHAPGTLPGLAPRSVLRQVATPEFGGITFHEIVARSALNRVPAASRVPFSWTVNPYRGCSHACVYCFARQSHAYLDLDAGSDFDSQIVVKVNVVEVLRRELARPSWRREPVALGTNTDPYQRAEGRYRLMPGIVRALADSGTPMSILTKGTTARRDLPLLREAARQVPVGLGVSLAPLDDEVHRGLEPGTPARRARLSLVRAIADAGLPCQVLVAPVLPYVTDSDEQLEAVLSQVATAGATSASVMALHLRAGAREWFWRYLRRHRPELEPAYERLYRAGAYVSRDYAADLADRSAALLRRYGLHRPHVLRPAKIPPDPRTLGCPSAGEVSCTAAPTLF